MLYANSTCNVEKAFHSLPYNNMHIQYSMFNIDIQIRTDDATFLELKSEYYWYWYWNIIIFANKTLHIRQNNWIEMLTLFSYNKQKSPKRLSGIWMKIYGVCIGRQHETSFLVLRCFCTRINCSTHCSILTNVVFFILDWIYILQNYIKPFKYILHWLRYS